MDNKKPTEGFPQVGCGDAHGSRHYSPESLPLEVVKDIPLVDSRILAAQLGRPPANQEKLKAQKYVAQLKRQTRRNLEKSAKLVADIEQLIIKLGVQHEN